MKKAVVFFAILFFSICLAKVAGAENKVDESKAMVKKAVEYIKANGRQKAMAEFNDLKGEFTKGELYIFVIDINGYTLANGGNAKLVGKKMVDLKDADGDAFMQISPEKYSRIPLEQTYQNRKEPQKALYSLNSVVF